MHIFFTVRTKKCSVAISATQRSQRNLTSVGTPCANMWINSGRSQLIDTKQTTVITRDGKRHNGNLMYTILPINVAVELQFQKQFTRAEKEKEKQKMMQKRETMQKKYPSDTAKIEMNSGMSI